MPPEKGEDIPRGSPLGTQGSHLVPGGIVMLSPPHAIAQGDGGDVVLSLFDLGLLQLTFRWKTTNDEDLEGLIFQKLERTFCRFHYLDLDICICLYNIIIYIYVYIYIFII